MRGDIVYHIFAKHQGRAEDMFFGAFSTLEEAQHEVAALRERKMDGKNWAARYHDKGFEIRTANVDTDFEIPPRPTPREKYMVKTTPKPNGPGRWDYTTVDVYQRADATHKPKHICTYERNYAMLQTFEPFRQGGREYALISRSYTRTAVLDLQTGRIIAEEPPESLFCPLGFYVPDWWDVHDGEVIPGSQHWNSDNEWPTGQFGFVWGCQWGDDSSWKVRYLDLSQIQQGSITCEERFSYVELAIGDYQSPCFQADLPSGARSPAQSFIQLSREDGQTRLKFAVEMSFDLYSGKPYGWNPTTE